MLFAKKKKNLREIYARMEAETLMDKENLLHPVSLESYPLQKQAKCRIFD